MCICNLVNAQKHAEHASIKPGMLRCSIRTQRHYSGSLNTSSLTPATSVSSERQASKKARTRPRTRDLKDLVGGEKRPESYFPQISHRLPLTTPNLDNKCSNFPLAVSAPLPSAHGHQIYLNTISVIQSPSTPPHWAGVFAALH